MSMSLQAVVKGRDKGDHHQWKEVADVISVSATGSSFNLARECEPGTLLSLLIPMQPHLRCYDYDKELYQVWGLVQHCEPITAGDRGNFHVGVAFIGKHCPEGYRANPMRHYRIAGVADDGMWTVEELRAPFKKRADVRFWKPVELYLALIDMKDGAMGGERTVAENISRSGASVFTTMNVGIGDRVKFISEAYDFSGLAVICDVQPSRNGRTRLHLSFVDANFPVERVMTPDVITERV